MTKQNLKLDNLVVEIERTNERYETDHIYRGKHFFYDYSIFFLDYEKVDGLIRKPDQEQVYQAFNILRRDKNDVR